MANSSPPELVRLLNSAPPDREAAWESFLAIHYRLLLHVTRSFAKEHDAARDADETRAERGRARWQFAPALGRAE